MSKKLDERFRDIEKDVKIMFNLHIRKAITRCVQSDRMLKQCPEMLEYMREDVGHQIGEYIVEHGFVSETKEHDNERMETTVDSRIYIIKEKCIEDFINSICLYILRTK